MKIFFDEIWGPSDPPIDSKGTTYEATRILFLRKENKNNDFIPHFVSTASLVDARSWQYHDTSVWRRRRWPRSGVMKVMRDAKKVFS